LKHISFLQKLNQNLITKEIIRFVSIVTYLKVYGDILITYINVYVGILITYMMDGILILPYTYLWASVEKKGMCTLQYL